MRDHAPVAAPAIPRDSAWQGDEIAPEAVPFPQHEPTDLERLQTIRETIARSRRDQRPLTLGQTALIAQMLLELETSGCLAMLEATLTPAAEG